MCVYIIIDWINNISTCKEGRNIPVIELWELICYTCIKVFECYSVKYDVCNGLSPNRLAAFYTHSILNSCRPATNTYHRNKYIRGSIKCNVHIRFINLLSLFHSILEAYIYRTLHSTLLSIYSAHSKEEIHSVTCSFISTTTWKYTRWTLPYSLKKNFF